MKLSCIGDSCAGASRAADARRPRQAAQIGHQVEVVAHPQLGVVADVHDALRQRRAAAPPRRRAPGRRRGCGWCRRRPRAAAPACRAAGARAGGRPRGRRRRCRGCAARARATPRARPKPAQLRFGIDAPARPVGGRAQRRGSRRSARRRIAVHAAGAAVDQAPHAAAARQRVQQGAGARVVARRWPGGGARCSTASARPPRRPSVAGSSRLPTSGTAPAARSSIARCGDDVSASTRQRPRSSCSTRRPTSPQPTISRRGRADRRRGRAARVARMGAESGLRAQSRRQLSSAATATPHELHRHLQPAAAASTSSATSRSCRPPSARASACPMAAATAPAARARAGCSKAA